MAALILTFMGSLFLSAAVWFAVGSRFRFDEEDQRNDWLNLAAYFFAAVPIAFVLVFFGLG